MNRDSSNEKAVRLRDRFREETAEAILAAAELVFAEEGLRGARMESIASRAGVAVGTVYNHFEDREALLAELTRSRRAGLLVKLDRALAEGEGLPFADALRRFLQALFSHWAAHDRFMSVLFQSESVPSPLQPRGKCRTIRQEIRARADKLLRRGVAQGALRPEGTEVQAPALVGTAWGILMRALEEQRLERVESEIDPVVDFFLHGAGR